MTGELDELASVDVGIDDVAGTFDGSDADAVEVETTALMPRAEWCQVILMGFPVMGMLTGLQSLQGAAERHGAIEAMGALYDTFEEIPSLHWMLQAEGKWIGRLVTIGSFAFPLVGEVRAEIAQRRVGGRTDGLGQEYPSQ